MSRRVEISPEMAALRPSTSSGPQGERVLEDVIAYLEQRRDNAALMARKSPQFAEQAHERQRQLGVIIDEFRAGMHHGAAEARAALLAGRDEGEGN